MAEILTLFEALKEMEQEVTVGRGNGAHGGT